MMGTVKPGALNEREDDSTAGISDRVENLKVVSGAAADKLPEISVPQAPPKPPRTRKPKP